MESLKKIWIVMCNDYPAAAFSCEVEAENHAGWMRDQWEVMNPGCHSNIEVVGILMLKGDPRK